MALVHQAIQEAWIPNYMGRRNHRRRLGTC